jgi:hypothetical protein
MAAHRPRRGRPPCEPAGSRGGSPGRCGRRTGEGGHPCNRRSQCKGSVPTGRCRPDPRRTRRSHSGPRPAATPTAAVRQSHHRAREPGQPRCPAGRVDRDRSSTLRPDFECGAGSEEADVEFEEKIDLSEDHRDGVLPGPCEGEPDRRERGDGGVYENDAGLDRGETAAEADRCCLPISVETELQSDAVRQHVDGRAGVEQR